ncbi:MAG: SCO family protein [Chloroflexi bacterium]|nr:SCO family protein [Chloroflexota bacterium]
MVAASPIQAHDPSAHPLSEVNFEQKMNEQVPLDLAFRDEAGQTVQLGDYFGEKPIILVFAYYGCKTLCSVVLEELVETLRALKFDVGDQFGVVTVSLDPGDTPALAAEKKAIQLEHYGRPGAATGWRFLTGEHAAIDQLAEAIGFRYAYDAQLDQYAHPAGIVVLTPQGKISRYFFGLEYSPTDLRLGLVEASANKIGSFVDQVLLRCFQYDPVAARYTPIVMNIVRLVGLTTALTLGTSILVMLRWERRRKNLQLDHTPEQETLA